MASLVVGFITLMIVRLFVVTELDMHTWPDRRGKHETTPFPRDRIRNPLSHPILLCSSLPFPSIATLIYVYPQSLMRAFETGAHSVYIQWSLD